MPYISTGLGQAGDIIGGLATVGGSLAQAWLTRDMMRQQSKDRLKLELIRIQAAKDAAAAKREAAAEQAKLAILLAQQHGVAPAPVAGMALPKWALPVGIGAVVLILLLRRPRRA